MKKVLIVVVACALLATVPAYAQQFKVTDQVKLGGEGGWDYLVYDTVGQRLFITRGSHVMVVDAKTLKVTGDIPDLARRFTAWRWITNSIADSSATAATTR